MKLILGSSSKFRQAQLKQLGIDFECFSPDVDEDSIKKSELTPKEISVELSLAKARKVLEKYPNDLVIGADQVLNFEGEIFDKPMTSEKAISQLKRLSGKKHELITSYALITSDSVYTDTIVSTMSMKDLKDEQIHRYIETDEPLWSCGSYKLETLGIALFDNIVCPDHSAIIGLPLISLTKALEARSFKVL